jgi:hypothetical protein
MTKDETTVARIAGDIASGFAIRLDPKLSGTNGAEGAPGWLTSVTALSVEMARALVAEVKRTSDEPPQPARRTRERRPPPTSDTPAQKLQRLREGAARLQAHLAAAASPERPRTP